MPRPVPRLALYTLVVCVLAVVAAVVSFARGNMLGIVWVLLAGLSSNMAWYYLRRAKSERAAADPASTQASNPAPAPEASRGVTS